MSPRQALRQVAAQHKPYLLVATDVIEHDPCSPTYGGGVMREATVEDKARSLEWWCDGCRTAADLCLAAPVLAAVRPAWWRRWSS